MFSTRSSLVKHLISAEHRRLTVICPWCAGKERTFTKISDLEVHVRKAHVEISLSKDYFSRPSGFYFAVHPEDYAKVVGTVTSYDSDIAFQMRKAVRTWVEGFSDRKDRTTKWNDGWKAGTRIVMERSRSKERKDTNSQIVLEGRVRTSEQATGNRNRCRAGSENRRGQKDGEKDSVKGGDKSWTEETDVDRRVVERRDNSMKRKQSETYVDHTIRGSKHSRVSTERTIDDLDTYEDNIELGNFEEETGNTRNDSTRKGENTGVEKRTGERDQDGLRGNESVENSDRHKRGGSEEYARRQREEVEQISGDDDAASTITSSSSSSSSSDGSTMSKDGTDADGFRTRAIQLLKRGAMPACPPAKRDWTSFGNTIEMDFDGQVLSWPPANWKKLTPDQRLMAHEYAAMFIEQRTMKNDFPRISRRTLIDKYAFLALDGEGKTREEEEEQDKVEAKIRQYNFSYIKGIAKGDIPSSRIAWSILKTLENPSRWEDTDVFTTKLDAGGVKIKI